MRQHKPSICFVFGISLVVLLGSLCWLKLTTLKEGYVSDYFQKAKYINIGDEEHMRRQANNMPYLELVSNPSPIEKIKIAAYNPSIFERDQSIFIPSPNITGISTFTTGNADYSINDIATDLMNDNPTQKIQWENAKVDVITKNMITISQRIPNPVIISDTCSVKSMIRSEFKEDLCETHAGNFEYINAKCQELSEENCKIPSCCVLLNGKSCVAGDKNGPIYTDNDTDFKYYFNKNTCYGNCDQAQRYSSACGEYVNSSTGISKACMIQMFNNYGCPNRNPDELINDDMVTSYSQTSKQYVENYIKTAVRELKAMKNTDICYGSN
jgi:hypothetical protein